MSDDPSFPAGESIAEKLATLKRFKAAGAQFILDSPGILTRETLRSKAFIQHQDINKAVDIRRAGNVGIYDIEDSRRAGYFRASMQRDPGPLSKFGEGDGSFFDRWLVNSKFHGSDGKFTNIFGDELRTKERTPIVGMKQWTMPLNDLKALDAKSPSAMSTRLALGAESI
jgi:hypothetical protein